jgi:hypothetical protein
MSNTIQCCCYVIIRYIYRTHALRAKSARDIKFGYAEKITP